MSEDLRQTTIDTYNRSATELANYFRGIGPRERYINCAFEFAGNPPEANVLEIGCGDGRDAKAIVDRTPNYLGIDASEEMIKLARAHVPEGRFEVADAAKCHFPVDLDIAFAFASFLHLNKSELRTVFQGLGRALKPHGIVYVSSKYRPKYEQEIKEDHFGRRLFHYYNSETMRTLAGPKFEIAKRWREMHGNTDWFEMILRKT